MQIDPTIFKAYDVRGLVPDQITGETAYQIGYFLVQTLKSKTIAVGRDMRVSSEEMFERLSAGIVEAGSDVVDLGLVSTDGLYFAVGNFGYDAGVMITASHNPKEYNGFKVCKANAEPLSGQDGLGAVLKAIEQADDMPKAPTRGVVLRKEISSDYADHCLTFIDVDQIKPFKIVIDAGNGVAGATLPPVLEKLPIEVTPLFFEPDGTFPNHPASPIELENLQDLIAKIKETDADFGVAFDGDADRMFLVDKDGRQIGGDMVTAMVSKSILAKSAGETVLYNLICSRAVPELVTKMNGTPIRTRVGHALIKPLMKEHNAVFGGEHSGHFYFRDNWFADSGLIACLVCLELISKEGRPLHQIVDEIDPYYRSGEINNRVESVPEVLERVADAFKDGQQDREDGLTVQFEDFWFNLRPSNTEPLLRLNIEANTPQILESRKEQLVGLIKGQP